MSVALSAEQQAVFDRIESTREHLFVTGRAGTGKSTLLNHLRLEHLEADRHLRARRASPR